MNRITLSLVLLFGLPFLALGKLTPLTVKDISLMLRSGYFVGVVEKEVAVRYFIEPIDATAEKALLQAGATPEFVTALKSGAYAVPAHEVAAAQKEMEEKARRRTLQAEEAKKFNTLYQDQLARSRATAKAPVAQGNAIATLVKGDLVASKNGILSSVNDQAFERKRFIALYFAARWCPSCRKFTPELVEYYNRVAAAHPEFEILFVSSDRSSSAMEAYMRDSQMPWPAVSYDKIKANVELDKYSGSGIPCLVVLDAQGKVISDSFDGKTYLGPHKVLADLDRIFATGSTGPVAQTP